ncbi:UNVERIFIED_CONTAM: hypothetical protein PYX00_010895 [Menopon gallinae]|uniref:Uncharacterized protein n=1 Tax=Menopon gallinae TaxID=328185 RepID=A0AAW2H6J9_9NEOP
MSLGLNLINIRLKEYLRTSQEKNLNRILLLDPQYKEEKGPFLLSENDWQETLSAQGLAKTSPLWKSAEDYFSTLSSYRAPVVLAGALSAQSQVIKTLKTWASQSDLTYFGHLALVGKTREEIANFSEYLKFCSASAVFLWYWEKASSATYVKNERFAIAVAHNQGKGDKEENAGLLEKALAEISYFLEKSPNESCLTVLRGASQIQPNTYSDTLKIALQTANVNQYFKSQGQRESEDKVIEMQSGYNVAETNLNAKCAKCTLSIKGQEFIRTGLKDAIAKYIKKAQGQGYKDYTTFTWTLPHMGVQLISYDCVVSRPDYNGSPMDADNNMVKVVFTLTNVEEKQLKE